MPGITIFEAVRTLRNPRDIGNYWLEYVEWMRNKAFGEDILEAARQNIAYALRTEEPANADAWRFYASTPA